MTPETFAAELAAIRHAGSVHGLVLMRGREILFQDSPYTGTRVNELAATLDDIAHYFEQEKRTPDQLVFGYDDGHLLILLSWDYRLVVFHYEGEEVDFVARAARSFLKDYAMDSLARQFAGALPE